MWILEDPELALSKGKCFWVTDQFAYFLHRSSREGCCRHQRIGNFNWIARPMLRSPLPRIPTSILLFIWRHALHIYDNLKPMFSIKGKIHGPILVRQEYSPSCCIFVTTPGFVKRCPFPIEPTMLVTIRHLDHNKLERYYDVIKLFNN